MVRPATLRVLPAAAVAAGALVIVPSTASADHGLVVSYRIDPAPGPVPGVPAGVPGAAWGKYNTGEGDQQNWTFHGSFGGRSFIDCASARQCRQNMVSWG